jgi:dihydrofolate reductase
MSTWKATTPTRASWRRSQSDEDERAKILKLSLVVAMSENRVIGRGADIPWKLRDEQQAVKALTMGHCLIMGRKTWESIGRPLPGRTSIVVTRQHGYQIEHERVVVVRDLDGAIAAARATGDDEAFIFGGAAIYREALPQADRLYLTRVHAEVEGDIEFPEFDESAWRLTEEVAHEADDRNEYAFTRQSYERA